MRATEPRDAKSKGSKYGRLRDVLPALLGDFRPFGRTKLRNWEAGSGGQKPNSALLAAPGRDSTSKTKPPAHGLALWQDVLSSGSAGQGYRPATGRPEHSHRQRRVHLLLSGDLSG